MAAALSKMAVPGPGELTVKTKEVLVVEVPSLTFIVIVATPVWPLAGMTVTVWTPELKQMMLAFGTRVGLEEVPLRVKPPTEVSASPMLIRNGPTGISTSVLLFGMAAIVGGLFTAPTAKTKESLELLMPSLTITVIVDEPDRPVTGVIVTVRFPPLPPKTILL